MRATAAALMYADRTITDEAMVSTSAVIFRSASAAFLAAEAMTAERLVHFLTEFTRLLFNDFKIRL
ncbi:hypothetical protein CX676_04335 [Paracoccus zhejiangensis]|uniref:Uncharacterized protein n=1 Tax=Paracoccus zhejiangensis TaxID=1077935 RepID=A0A2H5EW18_9RHOB|nr:hypothetical protein CX676_04335 [Paracoccus zhejiangensis]